MAHTKSQGKTNQKSNRPGQRLGIKKSGGQIVKVGQIISRQVGSTHHSGIGTKLGKDYTIYAIRPGIVKFINKLGKKYITVVKAAKKIVKKDIVTKKPIVKKPIVKKIVVKKVAVKKIAKKNK